MQVELPSIKPGTLLFYVHRPRKHTRGYKPGNWFRYETIPESFLSDPTKGRFDWDDMRITVFTKEEVDAIPWGGKRMPVVPDKSIAERTCNTGDSDWCWVYAGTVWSLDE